MAVQFRQHKMGTVAAKSTLQHTLASKQHMFTPILILIFYVSVTNCPWEAFRHGHLKDSKKHCLLWWHIPVAAATVGTLLL